MLDNSKYRQVPQDGDGLSAAAAYLVEARATPVAGASPLQIELDLGGNCYRALLRSLRIREVGGGATSYTATLYSRGSSPTVLDKLWSKNYAVAGDAEEDWDEGIPFINNDDVPTSVVYLELVLLGGAAYEYQVRLVAEQGV